MKHEFAGQHYHPERVCVVYKQILSEGHNGVIQYSLCKALSMKHEFAGQHYHPERVCAVYGQIPSEGHNGVIQYSLYKRSHPAYFFPIRYSLPSSVIA